MRSRRDEDEDDSVPGSMVQFPCNLARLGSCGGEAARVGGALAAIPEENNGNARHDFLRVNFEVNFEDVRLDVNEP